MHVNQVLCKFGPDIINYPTSILSIFYQIGYICRLIEFIEACSIILRHLYGWEGAELR